MITQIDTASIDSTDIIRDVVGAISPVIKIKSVVTDGDLHTITACNIYYTQPTYTVTIDGNNYEVQSIEAWDTMIVKGSSPINVDNFLLYTPYFFHGTPRAVNEELKSQGDAFQKTPMIWMNELFMDAFSTDENHPLEREITADIYALSHQIVPGQVTDDAYKNVVRPMRSLMDCLFSVMRLHPDKFDLRKFPYKVQNYYRFGVYVKDKGADRNIFVDDLAGVGTTLDKLGIWADGICKQCSTPFFLPAIPNMQIEDSFIIS